MIPVLQLHLFLNAGFSSLHNMHVSCNKPRALKHSTQAPLRMRGR